MDAYRLVEGRPVSCDMEEWAQRFKTERKVAYTSGRVRFKKVIVSTVFLGLDHNFEDTGAPILFETMVFGGKHDGECERYSTLSEAEKGHRQICRRIFD